MNRLKVALTALGSIGLALVTMMLVATPAAASSSPASKYGVLNAVVNAATVHENGTSSAFPNYTNGAVDNYYSMAHAYVDSSPFAEGTSSPADTGPLGQTVAAGNFSQPQYADARWNGSKGAKASFGNQGGPYATASADSYDAQAQCAEASSGSPNSSGSSSGLATPKGFAHRLRVALAAWKAHWLPRLGVKLPRISRAGYTLPGVTVPTVSTPTVTTPGVTTPTVPKVPKITPPGRKSHRHSHSHSHAAAPSGNFGAALDSTTQAVLDPKSGALVTTGESSLGTVSLGGGQIVLKGIDVTATVTNNGTPTDQVAIDVAAASIGGVPVSIDQNGVTIQGQDQALPYQQADTALNGALQQAGVQIYTVQPQVTKATNTETVDATGVHVAFAQPVDPSGVPAQTVDHILGEVYISSLATPAGPAPTLNLSGGTSSLAGGTSFGSTGSSTGFSGGGGGTGSSYSSTGAGTSGASTAPASVLTSALSKPMWLLVAYLVWQTLMIGTGVSLKWWPKGAS